MNQENTNTGANEYYKEANDRPTFMTEMDKCLNKLEVDGYKDQFRVENKLLHSTANPSLQYTPQDIKSVNFYRFEGLSDPDDMSILYAIETRDGRRGTLVDAFGRYSDDETGEFMKEVDVQKMISSRWQE